MSLQQEDRDLLIALIDSNRALTNSVAQLTACVADLMADRADKEDADQKPQGHGGGLDDEGQDD
ncbi:hypothetical protein [Lysobacter fragariae]